MMARANIGASYLALAANIKKLDHQNTVKSQRIKELEDKLRV